MRVVWLLVCARLRTGWRGALILGLLAGVAGGAVLGALAAERRTATAYDRFLEATDSSDVLVYPSIGSELRAPDVARLPEVVRAGRGDLLFLEYPEHRNVSPTATVSRGQVFYTTDRPLLRAGRLPDPSRADEVVIGPNFATLTGLRPGDDIPVRLVLREPGGPLVGPPRDSPELGPEVRLRITGIGGLIGHLSPGQQGGFGPMFLTPAFAHAYGDVYAALPVLYVDLRHGEADIPSFRRSLEAITGGLPFELYQPIDEARRPLRGVRVVGLMLSGFSVLAGLTGLLIVAQALARRARRQASAMPTLGALGVSRTQLRVISVLETIPAASIATVLAVALAVAVSPLAPVGAASNVEPNRGVSVDGRVLAFGAPVVVAVVLGLATVLALPARPTLIGKLRTSYRRGRRRHRPRISDSLTRSGLPAPGLVGLRLATTARSPTSRVTIVGAVIAAMGLGVAVAFGASLDRLLRTPRLYGWNFDVSVGRPADRDLRAELRPALQANPDVAGLAEVAPAILRIAGEDTNSLGIDATGEVLPPLVAGRPPRGADEVVLGGTTLERAGRRVGETVEVVGVERSAEFRIVGQAVLPDVGLETTEGDLARGTWFTVAGVQLLAPETPVNLFLVRARPGRAAALLDALRREYHGRLFVVDWGPPDTFTLLGGARRLPFLLAGVIATMAAASLFHTLTVTVGDRRRDMAILKTVGFTRGQVAAAVACHATLVTGVGLGVGLPVGVGVGRLVWRLFAEHQGVLFEPVFPLVGVVLAFPAGLLLANVVAVGPARRAARTLPAVVLRSP